MEKAAPFPRHPAVKKDLYLPAALTRQSLVAVLDESGTTNVPTNNVADHFSVAGVVFRNRHVARLASLDQKIRQATRKADYKYKHVIRHAAPMFVSASSLLPTSVQFFGFYAAGGSLQRERERVDKLKFGPDSCPETPHGSIEENLRSFIQFGMPALANYAQGKNTVVHVYFDRRNDINKFEETITSHLDSLREALLEYRLNQHFVFYTECPPDMRGAARLAGVLAGDVCRTFEFHGSLIWKKLEQHGFVGRLTKQEIEYLFHNRLGSVPLDQLNLPFVNTVEELDRDSVLTGFLANRYINGLLSFVSPDGILGHINAMPDGTWGLWQLPD